MQADGGEVVSDAGGSSEKETVMAKTIETELQDSLLYWIAKRMVKEEILKSKYRVGDLESHLPSILEDLGIRTQLRNMVHVLHSNHTSKVKDEVEEGAPPLPKVSCPHAVMDEASSKWNKNIRDSFLSVAAEATQSMGKQRKDSNEDESEGETTFSRYVYESKHVLESIGNIFNKNHTSIISGLVGWGMVKLEVRTPELEELQVMFADLHPDYRQYGLDDEIKGWFLDERLRLGKKALDSSYIPIMRQFSKRGVPNSIRPEVYAKILGVDMLEKDFNYLEQIMQEVDKWDLITDDLIRLDIHETATDDTYFVFEDILETVLIAMSRDKWLAKNCAVGGQPKLNASTRNGVNIGTYPPSGIVPFRGFVLLAAPLCFLYAKEEQLYYVFRGMYARYFCRLHTLSMEPGTLVPLCKLFEELVQIYEPEVFYHLAHLGVQPLEIAFDWIFYAFAGYLEVDQVLLLWDRMVGFDSMELLPILSASIFVFRSKAILKTTSVDEVQDLFESPKELKVVPLLQHFLFK